jgi:hypothetical protein
MADGAKGADRADHAFTSVTVASAAIPSSRPVKPSLLGRCRLDRDAIHLDAQQFGQTGAHGGGLRPDLGSFADQRHIGMGDGKSPRGGPVDGMGQEDMAFRALPLRVAGREMRADIALGQGAIDRIGQRVQTHIRIRMSLQATVMRHGHAAQHHVIAGAETMHVKAVAGADIHVCPFEDTGRAVEIARCRDLEVVFVPRHDGHVEPCGPRHLHVIGRITLKSRMGGKDRGEVKALRRLRPPEPVTRNRPLDQSRAAPQRIGHRKGRGRARMIGKGRDDGIDHLGRHAGAGHVMDQHQIGRAVERAQPRHDRGPPRRPSGDTGHGRRCRLGNSSGGASSAVTPERSARWPDACQRHRPSIARPSCPQDCAIAWQAHRPRADHGLPRRSARRCGGGRKRGLGSCRGDRRWTRAAQRGKMHANNVHDARFLSATAEASGRPVAFF